MAWASGALSCGRLARHLASTRRAASRRAAPRPAQLTFKASAQAEPLCLPRCAMLRLLRPQTVEVRSAIGSAMVHLGVPPGAMVGVYSVNCPGACLGWGGVGGVRAAEWGVGGVGPWWASTQ